MTIHEIFNMIERKLVIDQGLAAIIAAISALFASYSAIRSNKLISSISSKQNILGDDLQNLSHYIYQVVALSVEAAKSKSTDRFEKKIAEAEEAANILSKIRVRNRYTIPFIFDSLWYMKGVPLYTQHYKNNLDHPQLKIIQRKATELRCYIDTMLERYFFEGKSPGYFARRRLKKKCKRLERAFLEGSPKKTKPSAIITP